MLPTPMKPPRAMTSSFIVLRPRQLKGSRPRPFAASAMACRLRADRIASFLGDDPGEFLHPRLDGICNLLQHTPALSRNDAAPACEGLARSLHGPADVVGTAARNAGNDLAVPRSFNRYVIAGGAVDPAILAGRILP
jgi:hypothetical protein